MAQDNPFGFGAGFGAKPKEQSKTPATRAQIEDIARRTQVPSNLLMAYGESGEADIEGLAGRIASQTKAGRKIEEIVPPALLNRAYDIADAMYPKPEAAPKPKPISALARGGAPEDLTAAPSGQSVLDGLARGGAPAIPAVPPSDPRMSGPDANTADSFAGEGFGALASRRGQQAAAGATEVFASVPEALAIADAESRSNLAKSLPPEIEALAVQADAIKARLADPRAANHPMRAAWEQALTETEAQISEYASAMDAVAKPFNDQTDSAASHGRGVLPADQTSTFKKGDALRASSAETFGTPDPRDQSFWGQVAYGAGNAAGFAGSSIAAGIAGGPAAALAVGGGAGAAMNASQMYKEAKAAGADEETATLSAKLGAAIGFIEIIPINRALRLLPPRLRGELTKGFVRKAVDVLKSAGEEAAQEYISAVANNMVAQQLYDPERGWTEGATEQALVGAVLGGGMGTIGAAFDRGEKNTGAQAAPQIPEQQPNTNLGTDGSGTEQGAGTGMDASSGMAAPAPDNMPVAPPRGPIQRAAESAPDLTPQPAAPEAPPMFPDQKAGAAVRLLDPETGEIMDGVFQREEDGFAIVRINGEEVDIAPKFFDQMMQAARKLDDAGGEFEPAPAPPTFPEDQQPDKPYESGFDAAASALQERGFNDVGAPPAGPLSTKAAPKGKGTPAPDPFDGITAEEAQRRLDNVNERMRAVAKPSKKMIETRDKLQSIIDAAKPEAQNDANIPNARAASTVPAGADQASQPTGIPISSQPTLEGGRGQYKQPDGASNAKAGLDAEPKPKPVDALTTRPSASPITTRPDERIQPDLLGGDFTTEEAMATKERRKKEWGRYLAIAEAGTSNDDMSIDGRDVLIRKGFTVIRAVNGQKSDKDYRLDTEGMSRDQIASAMRGALGEMNRIAPIVQENPVPRITPPSYPKLLNAMDQTEDGRWWNDLPDADKVDVLRRAGFPERTTGAGVNWGLMGKENREKIIAARVQPNTPATKADQEFTTVTDVYGDTHRVKSSDLASDKKMISRFDKAGNRKDGMPLNRENIDVDGSGVTKTYAHLPFVAGGGRGPDTPLSSPDSVRRQIKKFGQNVDDFEIREVRGGFIGVRKPKQDTSAPTRAEFDAAAAETNPNPTPAQAEAENYKTGKTDWNGLTLSIENAKGSMRRKVTPDGKTEWEVKMPAHYGRILGTKGADGDHVDFYMGPAPDSDVVVVVDQADAETGKFDEHKAMLGFKNRKAALDHYVLGFSDGKGKDRLSGHKIMTVVEFKDWLENGDMAKPARDVGNGTAGVLEITKPRTGETSIVDTQPSQPAPKKGTQPIGTNDRGNSLFEDENGVRSYTDGGVRITETVSLTPTKENGIVTSVNKGNRNRDYLTQEEWAAKDQEAVQKQRAIDQGKGDATKGRLRKVPGWAVGTDFAADYNAGFNSVVKTADNSDSVAKPPAAGLLSVLSDEKQKRADELKAKLAAKARNQISSGVDPEYLTLGGELVSLYVEAGIKRFGQMLRDFAESTGLTMREAQVPMRVAYNYVRDEMDLKGEDVSEFDTADQVMAEIRKAMAEDKAPVESPVSQSPENDGMVDSQKVTEAADDNRDNASNGGTRTAEGAKNPADGRKSAGELREGGNPTRPPSTGVSGQVEQRPRGGSDAARSSNEERDGVGPVGAGAKNHVILPGQLSLARGDKTRARESIAAIKVLRQIQAEGRPATDEDRATLAKYGGAGTLAKTLPASDGSIIYPDLADEIDSLTTPEERATLSRTSQYAFYTAESALRSMWALAQRLGFNGGRVYEPGMGVGGFAGTMPQGLDATYTGVELDHITAQIAAALYPKHKIKNGDFIKERLPQNFYDLAIGNPPFSSTRIQADEDYPQGFMIHDYFFAKTLDSVRHGGLLMFITSAGTMNKQSPDARNYLADRADLVGAIRLPNTAFKENGTEVTTDIIVLRKRLDGEAEANPSWRKSVVANLPDENGQFGQANVNQYFMDNPDMILGEQGLYDTLVAGARVGVRPKPNSDLATELKDVLEKFPKDIMSDAPASVTLDALDAESAEKKAGSFYLKGDDLYQFDGYSGKKVEPRGKDNTKGTTKAAMQAIKALIPIKGALRDVYAADVDGKDATEARRELNALYDAYVAANGPIGKQERTLRRPSVVEQETARVQALNDARSAGLDFDIGSFDPRPMIEAGAKMSEIARSRAAAREQQGYREGTFDPEAMPDKVVVKRPNIDPFMDDPESYRLLAMEKYDQESDTAQKTLVFTENAVRKTVKPKISSPEDALLFLLAETGRVDPAKIAQMANSTEDRIINELKGKIFLNPKTREWETKSKYLSGNVVMKLEDAERAAIADPTFAPNVDELRSVQPDPVPAAEIAVPIGAHWFPASVYSDFAKELGLRFNAEYKKRLGVWLTSGSNSGAAAETEWGTPDKPFADLMALVMANKKIEVRRTRKNADSSKESWLDEEATQAANDKAIELQNRFSEWFWGNEARAADMEALYNRIFNSDVAPKYDGSYLTTPGINAAWQWRPHQTAVVARILQSGDTYMAHTVGAGKTSAMIGTGMEARRLGLAQKPWYVVPNHMLIQFATEFYQQYPLAKVLVADDRRFHTDKRKQFVADAAMGDYDAVIITHSGFEMIPPSEEAKKLAVEGMIQEIRDVLENMGSSDAGLERSVLGALNSMAAVLGVDVDSVSGDEKKTRKKIEALLEAAEQRIARQASDKGKDAVFNFDETGADMMFVDEAHLFRKLSFATSMGSIKGVDPQGSQQSMDLYIKAMALARRNPGRSLVLASGTPITNTMAELYSISRYLQPKALEDRGVSAFDSWAATFGRTESALEQAPDGGYKLVTRFSKFVNTPELSLMVRQVMDVVSGPDLEKYVTRPKLKGGKRNLVVVDASPELKAYQAELGQRMRKIEQRKGPVQKGDDILLSVINDGRLAAIDMRLVDPEAGDTNSKLEKLIQGVYRRWRDGANTQLHGVKKEGGYTTDPIMTGPSTQIVFSTLGINPTKHNPTFSVHRYIKAQLVALGVPPADIVLSEDLDSDARKQQAFNDMNEGEKRILIGSKTLFTGVNAQRRIAAIHNLDPLWYPADDEQRNGRGIRQGNMNPEIEVLDYSAKGTYDATMWQMMARKAGFIEGFFRGDPSVRDIEDLGEASQYEQAKAMSTADPRVLRLTELRGERDMLARRASAAINTKRRMESSIRSSRRGIELGKDEVAYWTEQAAKVVDTSGDAFAATVGVHTFTERKAFGTSIIEAAETALGDDGPLSRPVGRISDFEIEMRLSRVSGFVDLQIKLPQDRDVVVGWSDDPVGLARKIEYGLANIKTARDRAEDDIARLVRLIADTKAVLSKLKDFAEQDKLDELDAQVSDLESDLLSDADKTNEMRPSGREPVAIITGKELGRWEDMRQLAKKAEAWYRDNLIAKGDGAKIKNRATGWEIGFSRAGRVKTGDPKKGDDLLRAVVALPAILEKGVVVSSEPDNRGRREIKAVHKIGATVRIDGRDVNLIATVRETINGTFHYDLSMDDGRGRNESEARQSDAQLRDPALERSPTELNLQFAPPSRKGFNDPDASEDDIRAITRTLNAMPEVKALGGVVSVKVARRLFGQVSGNPILGRFNADAASIDVKAGSDYVGVMRHEIIHALRSEKLWNKPHGLFTDAEWSGLALAAQAEPEIVESVMSRYGEKDKPQQVEEMVAELYRLWSQQRDGYGRVAKTLAKIEAFLQAFANALRGQGFNSAALTMERIASGKIGGRGPDGPRGGGMQAAEERGAEMRNENSRHLLSKAVVNKIRADLQAVDRADPAYPMSRIPEVLERLGINNAPLIVRKSVFNKAMGKHGLSIDEAIRAIEGLADPIMVFDSDTSAGAFVSLVDVGNDKAVVVAVYPEGEVGRMAVSFVASIHEKDNPSAILRWVNDGLTRYINRRKADAWFQSRRLQLPREGTKHRRNIRILQHGDVFKSDNGNISEMRALPGTVRDKFKNLVGTRNWSDPKTIASNILTDAVTSKNWTPLALVPGRALFAELGKDMFAARRYLRVKEEMDTLRNDWHATAADLSQEWIKAQAKDPDANEAMMDLMHRSTMAGIDPSKDDPWGKNNNLLKSAHETVSRFGDDAPDWAKDMIKSEKIRKQSYATIKAMYDALHPDYQDMYRKVKAAYESMDKDFDKALEDNIKNASRIALKRAEREHRKEMRRISDEGLTGVERDAALEAADLALAKVQKRAQMGVMSRIKSLRKTFESQKLQGPYFPLARFGNYFATVRDAEGKVISFSRFESVAQQTAFVRQAESQGKSVRFGLMADKSAIKDEVDPKFVADIEMMLSDTGASPELMDAIWQRYLQTMPDQSIRTTKIHRKGREGFSKDALRSFTSHMFHGAHQLARLRYGLELQESIEDAMEEARRADDPNRATALVNEMGRRMEWTMNPTNAPWVSAASSAAFVWYLGASPAAALVNITQTTMIGPAVMKAGLKKATVGQIVTELGKAAKDFSRGRGQVWTDTWSAENSPDIPLNERMALKEGYRRGTIDKTQGHDLASVAESGVEFNPAREKWMKRIGFFFHHTERFNREVTFLAAYRLAVKDGLDHGDAIEKASDLTWKTHFSYQNSDRPRFMQGDFPKLFLGFRQFTVNLLYRLFRDSHQALYGKSKEERREARTQLIGITLSMMAHAGIKGVWGYALIMGLLSIFFPGDDDDLEEWMQDALLMEGDSASVAAWNFIMGAALNGIPGQITGTNLTERIGSPNLWFRGSDRELEGRDWFASYLAEAAGPVVGIGFSLAQSAQDLSNGDYVRALENAVPKGLRDIIKTGRYAWEGVTTRNGDDLVADINPYELLLQANGFTPARVAERYDINNRLKNREKRVVEERKDIQDAAGDMIRDGKPISESVMEKIRDFNRRWPEYPITGDTIKQSVQSRIRASNRNEFGISLNPKINDRLRQELAPSLYN